MMGEAKRNAQEQRARFITTLEAWLFETSPWEGEMVEQILELQAYEVFRYPAALLSEMKMKPQQCHANSAFMENADPEGLCRQVSGWTYDNGNLVLHSVVSRHGEMFCVTPVPPHINGPMQFIPDDALTWKDEGGGLRTWYRGGKAIGPGLRADPEKTVAQCQLILARLQAGMSINDAAMIR